MAQVRPEVSVPDWLAITKLSPPASRRDIIPRPGLVDALQTGITCHRLVLLSAPAGSGKTTLMEMAVQNLSLPWGWVAVDEEDNDPVRFLTVLIAALQRLQPGMPSRIRPLLHDVPNPVARTQEIIGALINDLVTVPKPAVLALDDLHRLTEPAIFGSLDYLLERLPPQIHLVIATRHDPPLALARLRARGELVELRLPDLRFTREETALFLREGHDLDLPDDALSLLNDQIEGWAAGIRLLAGALACLPTRHDRDTILASLSRVDRQVFSFLMEEVLRRESADMQTFLLETSILNKLTPSLCRTVTGRDDASSLLDDLEHRNLFVTPLNGSSEPTFRYHELFAGFLRQQLERERPGSITELHRRAAQAQLHPIEAIGHLLVGELWEEAAQHIEALGEALLSGGLAATLDRWLTMLPDIVVATHPRLLYFRGLVLWRRGEATQAQSTLESAASDLAAIDARLEEGESVATLATIALMQGDDERARKLIEQALSLPVRPPTRVQLLLERGRAQLRRGEEAAPSDLDTALKITRHSPTRETVAALLTYLHPIFAGIQGGLERVEQACHLATSVLGSDEGPLRIILDEQWALIHLHRGSFNACTEAGTRAMASRERYGTLNPLMDLWTIWSLAVVHAAGGQYAEAERHSTALLQLSTPGEAQRGPALYTWGWLCWLQGHSRQARDALRELRSLDAVLPVTPILQAMLHGLLLLSEGNHTAAERSLRQAVVWADELSVSIDLHGNPALLLAHLYLVTGHPRKALDHVAPILDAAERDDTPGLIAKEGAPMIPLMQLAAQHGVRASVASRVLEVLGIPREGKPVRVPTTGEVLSRREVELLRLLASGATNREIAECLVIGDQTVKTHVSHILRKLDASSRTEAAARARELRLL